MNKTITKHEFYLTVKVLVSDALAHPDTQQGKDWRDAGMPFYYRRHLQLKPRRDIGKTYASCLLAAEYAPTLFVFHSRAWMDGVILRPARHDYCPTNSEYAFTSMQVTDPNFIPTLGDPGTILPPMFDLGIIEDSGAVRTQHSERHLDHLRDTMFQCCKIVLEFG